MAAKQPRSKQKPAKAPVPPPTANKFIDIDITDTPEFLALAGIEPRLYEGSESIILRVTPRRDSERSTHVSAEQAYWASLARVLAPPKKPPRKRSKSKKPPPTCPIKVTRRSRTKRR